ncbi:MAG: FHA domain-containing protein [Methyloprofundus sp.]|nr:FHA domain-containing protein [Methyloprofundus sp.]
MKTLRYFLLVTLLATTFPVISATQFTVFDFQKKCLPRRALTALAGLPRDYSNAQIDPSLRSYQLNPSALQGKAKTAYQNFQIIDQFFRQELNWKSVDNKNTPILLLTNLEVSPCGEDAVNAFFLTLGSRYARVISILFGHKQAVEDVANDIEVLGHEFTHGVFNATQGQRLEFELKALNEGISDIFGVTIRAWYESGRVLSNTRVRQNSFKIGKNISHIFRTYYHIDMPVEGIRDNRKPNLSAPPGDRHYSSVYTGGRSSKYSASHVVSYAYALLVTGKTVASNEGDIQIQGLGFERAIKIVFYALRHQFTFNSMPEFALAVKKAARKMHGKNSAEFIAVHNAFAAVGLFDYALDAAQIERERADREAQEQEPAEQEPVEQIEAEESTESTELPPNPESLVTLSPRSILFIFLGFLMLLMGLAWSLTRKRQQQLQRHGLQDSVTDVEPLQAFTGLQTPLAEATLDPQISAARDADTQIIREPQQVANLAIAAVIELQGEAFALDLDNQAIILGREEHLDLPPRLKVLFAKDVYLGRNHCQLWYKAATQELYILCQSSNGMQVNGKTVDKNAKVKVDFKQAVNLVLGKTALTIAPL